MDPDVSEIHSNFIRAIARTSLTCFVDIRGMTAAIGVIRVETVVRNGYGQKAVTVDVDAV